MFSGSQVNDLYNFPRAETLSGVSEWNRQLPEFYPEILSVPRDFSLKFCKTGITGKLSSQIRPFLLGSAYFLLARKSNSTWLVSARHVLVISHLNIREL